MADARAGVRNATKALGGSNTPRMCLHYVRTWLNAPGGAPTASAAWAMSKHKHRRDYNAPAGVPVYFSPNHVALSIGDGKIISTDWPRSGHVGQTTIRTLEKRWNHRYLGWAANINGVPINNVSAAGDVATPAFLGLPDDPLAGLEQGFSEIGNAFKWVADQHNWLRVAEVLGGVILLLMAVFSWDTIKDTASKMATKTKTTVKGGSSA